MNAVIGDKLDDRLEEFFNSFADDDVYENSAGNNQENPVFMRNTLP